MIVKLLAKSSSLSQFCRLRLKSRVLSIRSLLIGDMTFLGFKSDKEIKHHLHLIALC